MRFQQRARRLRAATVVLGLALAGTARAGAPADSLDGGWRFLLRPYLWAPRIDGTLNFTARPGSGDEFVVSVDPIDYLEHLDVPLMLAAAVGKGAWTLATDYLFVDFSGESATVTSVSGPGGSVEVPIDAGSRVGLRGTLWTMGGGYAAVRGRSATLEILGGFRYFAVKTSLDWHFAAGTSLDPQTGSLSQTEDLWAGIVGVRGDVRLGASHWLLPYYLDAGAGSGTLTWDAVAGLGYAFGWGDVRLMYHHIQYDAEETAAIQRLRLTGPALGASFRF
jgi:hypothetical protein